MSEKSHPLLLYYYTIMSIKLLLLCQTTCNDTLLVDLGIKKYGKR